ncbi:MAG TPA: DnaA/Hda family protein [Xanthobacteraceae bacterium]|nr:DnaA/Hda family protein [Xanthobacteraceae bacterium]
MPPPRQLALALGHDESFAREDFLSGPQNEAALKLIGRWPEWPARSVLLVGPEGSGKSHLAAIWASASGARTTSARLLEETSVPEMLATGALVVEDLSTWHLEERALFHLLNMAREDGCHLLFTARTLPGNWQVALPDLASRLREIPVVTLEPPDDALLRAVLVKLFADRQVAVEESLIAYLVTRMERSFAAARAAVSALDREALRQKRPVTRALAGELFRDPAA